MKTGLTSLLCLSFATLATADTVPAPVASEVAGFASFDVPAAESARATKLSLKGIGLVKPAEYQGVSESHRGKTIVDLQATWTDNQFSPAAGTLATATHYVEITTGPLAGAIFDIVRTEAAAHRITLAQTPPVKVGATFGYRIRRHWTLAGLFGTADEAALQSGDESTADLVALYNGKAYVSFYYSNGAAGVGWRRVGGGEKDEAGRQIYPDDGLSILRRSETPVSPLIKGVVKTDRMLIAVQKGLNLLANTYQAPLTLATSNLFTHNPGTGLRAGASASVADNVLLYNGSSYDTYYYQTNVRNGNGWRLLGNVHGDAGNVSIPVGGAVLVRRRGLTGFNWFPPVPVTSK